MGRNWAIAIGINKYDNLQNLNYAQRDAEAMKDWFEQSAKFDQVFLFTEDSADIANNPPISTKPTFGRLRRFFRVNFEKPLLSAGDNLWFFFAGHGQRDADRDYLMLSDSDPGDVENSALSVSWITERLRRWGADNVVLFLDACRNSGARDGIGIGTEKQPGVITFYACRPNQQSYEIEQLNHGSFTHSLLESLQIQGEGNCATVERLYQRLRHRVSEINRKYQKPWQSPYAVIEPATKFHLILLPDYATLADISQLKLDAYQAEVTNDWELARQLWIRVNVAARGSDMQAIEAFSRIAQKSRNLSAVIPTPETPNQSRGEEIKTIETLPIQETKLKVFQFEVITVNFRGEEVKREQGKAEYFTEDLGNGVTLEMVSIPGGSFKMGSSPEEQGVTDEEPQHTVNVAAFFMGKFEVTQEQYQQVMGKNPSRFRGNKRPVEQVSWNNAVEFCKKLSEKTGRTYRLPSEAEWEYACRAGTTTLFHFGETITTDLANYDGNDNDIYPSASRGKYRQETTEVGKFPPNNFGLHDMHGNVRELCQDTQHEDYNGAPKDSRAWIDNNNHSCTLRGGSWTDYPFSCRSASRFGDASRDSNYFYFGFRVVCAVGRALN